MKVAYLTHLYTNTRSGPGRFAEYLRQFSSDKISFTFFSDNLSGTVNNNEVSVKSINFLERLPGYWLIRSWFFYSALKSKTGSFDLVLVSNCFEAFIIVKLIKNVPVVVMINDDNYIYGRTNIKEAIKVNPLRKFISRYFGFSIERMVAKEANNLVACSNYLKGAIVKKYLIEESKIKVIYPSVDLEFFRPFRRPYFNNEVVNLLFVKNDWRRGGLDRILKGLSKVRSWKKICLHVVGPPKSAETRIRALKEKYGFQGEVKFYGILDIKKILLKYYEADVFVLLSRQEAFGLSILEAMATGTPVIASSVGGIPEALGGPFTGFMLDKEDDDFTFTLEHLIRTPLEVLPRIESGIEHSNKFSKKNLYSVLENYILEFKNK